MVNRKRLESGPLFTPPPDAPTPSPEGPDLVIVPAGASGYQETFDTLSMEEQLELRLLDKVLERDETVTGDSVGALVEKINNRNKNNNGKKSDSTKKVKNQDPILLNHGNKSEPNFPCVEVIGQWLYNNSGSDSLLVRVRLE